MPNSVRLPSSVTKELLPNLRPGMEVWVGNDRLHIPAHNFSFRLPETTAWEPRPDVSTYRWHRKTVAQHVRLLAHLLADKPQQGGVANTLMCIRSAVGFIDWLDVNGEFHAD
jgi:hypothetical protein